MAKSKLPKWHPSKMKKREHEWPGPETLVDAEPVYVVGAMVSVVNVDTRNHDEVEVILATAASEVLDKAGEIPLKWYRMTVPTDNAVIQQFFGDKPVNRTGEYRNPQFQADVVIEGDVIGHDSNPEDVSRSVQVIRGNLMFLDEAMSSTMGQPTTGMARCTLKVDLPSQLDDAHTHTAGSEAVVVSTTVDNDTFLIEIQAEGFQECLEVPRVSIEFTVDDSTEGVPN